MEPSRRIIYSRIIFITGILLLTSLSILFVFETYEESSSSDVVHNSTIARQSLERIYALLKDHESSFRGFALTGDSSYLLHSSSSNELDMRFALIDSVIDSPGQHYNLQKLKRLVDFGMKRQDSVIQQLANTTYAKSKLFYSDLKKSDASMDSIEHLIDKMQRIESKIASGRELDAKKHTVLATMVGVAVSMFSILIFIIAFYFVDQELKRSNRHIQEKEVLYSKIAEINTALEQANRTLQQLNAELEGKNFQLEKYAAELSAFTHITSHDMQEPLRKIEFFISIVEEQDEHNLSDKGRRYMEKIRESVGRMRQLFLSMLDFSLANTIDKKLEDVELNDVFDQTMNALKTYIKDTNSMIERGNLPVVKGIRYQLRQLFENIISNAIKFRRNDVIPEIQITVTYLASGDQTVRGLRNDCPYYRIDFKDNGIGFDPHNAEKIFGIFQRLKTDSYGVGIGLAICRKIAENHGGIVVAESTPQHGSTFSVYLPRN
jgi:signal transduction histidine kinase